MYVCIYVCISTVVAKQNVSVSLYLCEMKIKLILSPIINATKPKTSRGCRTWGGEGEFFVCILHACMHAKGWGGEGGIPLPPQSNQPRPPPLCFTSPPLPPSSGPPLPPPLSGTATIHLTPPFLPTAHLAVCRTYRVIRLRAGHQLLGLGAVEVSLWVSVWLSYQPEHGGVGQREHQPAGYSLSKAPTGCESWTSAWLCGGYFHHAEVSSGCWAPQLPLGLRESRGHPQCSHCGIGGHFYFLLNSHKGQNSSKLIQPGLLVEGYLLKAEVCFVSFQLL